MKNMVVLLALIVSLASLHLHAGGFPPEVGRCDESVVELECDSEYCDTSSESDEEESEESDDHRSSFFDSRLGRGIKILVCALAVTSGVQQMIPPVAAAPHMDQCHAQGGCQAIETPAISTSNAMQHCVEQLGVRWRPDLLASEMRGRPADDYQFHTAVVICQKAIYRPQDAADCLRAAQSNFTGIRGGEHIGQSMQVCVKAGFNAHQVRACSQAIRYTLTQKQLRTNAYNQDLALMLCLGRNFHISGIEKCLAKIPENVSYGQRLYHAERCSSAKYEPVVWRKARKTKSFEGNLEQKIQRLYEQKQPPDA